MTIFICPIKYVIIFTNKEFFLIPSMTSIIIMFKNKVYF